MMKKENTNSIIQALKELEGVKQLTKALDSVSAISVSGLDDAAATAVIAAVKDGTNAPFLLLCENELAARRNAEDLNSLGVSARALPPLEISFIKSDASSQETSLQRLTALGDFLCGKVQALVVPAEAAIQYVCSGERFKESITTVKSGETQKPEILIKQLTEAGYERAYMVESKGQCSMRGGIVDIFPVSMANAIRIEFFDDEIDSIREFDVLTQRSLNALDEVCVYPAKEALMRPEEAQSAAQQLETLLTEESGGEKLDRQRSIEKQFGLVPFEKFFELAAPEDAGESETDEQAEAEQEVVPNKAAKPEGSLAKRYLPIVDALQNGRFAEMSYPLSAVLCPGMTSVIELIPGCVVFLAHADGIKQRMLGLRDDFLLNYKAAFERGEALRAQSEILLGYEKLLCDLTQHKTVCIDAFLRSQYDIAPKALVQFESYAAARFNSNTHELAKEIKRRQEEGAQIALLTGGTARGQRLSRTLYEEGVVAPFVEEEGYPLKPGVPVILPWNLSGGFVFPQIRLHVYSEDDVFGRGKQKKRAGSSQDKKTSAFIQLKQGDYVVHENHGIGQYLGTVRMTVEGVARDFLYIRYGGTDKLYVPTDQMDRVQKYIGSEGETPRLSSLSGGDWQKQKAKVRRSIKEIAGELIELYAQRSTVPGYAFSPDTPWQKEFEDAFPFEETPDQVTAIAEIKHDMEQPTVMDRLLCGDVGYGKTEVALRAVFKCVMDGKQAVLLAPTTILVQQHYATALNRFGNFPVHIETLSRFKSAAEQKEIIKKLKTGEIDFVIGTHRLLSSEIEYKDLGLLVVDEEQRFGVGHKEKIKQYKKSVDVLTMTATPIPRTLHMSMVGIRDMSILNTPPEERYPVQTYVCEYSDGLVRDAILRELARDGQVYVLYNRVQSIELIFNRLKKLVPEARIAFAHGQMKEQNLEDVMLDFYDGKFDVLLCSTIIEAGLDVPRANTLIVYDADHFGLSQLYQLRGRVGRSNRIAYAYLTVNPRKILTQDAEKRLNAIREFTEFGSGFRVAMRDLEIRGTGNILGAEQSGHMAAVGYDLYVKMINEAVAELQGTNVPSPIQARIDLQLDAFIPAEYISADSMRIEMYKRIAEIHDDTSRDDVIDELIDRFGDPGKPVMNLIYISQLKSACEALGIDHVSYRQGAMLLRFSPDAALDPQALVTALKSDRRMKLLPRMQGMLSFAQTGSSLEKLITDCTQALEQVKSRMDAAQPKEA